MKRIIVGSLLITLYANPVLAQTPGQKHCSKTSFNKTIERVESVDRGEKNNEKALIIITNNDSTAFHQKTCGFEEDLYNDGFRGYR